MGWYIGRRVLQMIPVFLGSTLLIFALVFLLPGDPVRALFGDKPASPAAIAILEARYHLDQPFLVQYLYYLKGLFTLNLGETFSGRPVLEVMAGAFPVTLRLTTIALIVEAVFGIAVGTVAALRRGKLFDNASLLVTLVLIAVPIFVIGFVARYVFAEHLKWTKSSVGDGGWVSLILPGIVLGSVSFAYCLRLTRNAVIESRTADYVRTATAKGLSRRRVLVVHVLRNSLIPVVTFLGTDVGSLMAGAVVTEGIFNIPGVGGTLYKAVLLQEGPTVVSFVTVLVVIYLVINLLVDILYAVLDPRIRYA